MTAADTGDAGASGTPTPAPSAAALYVHVPFCSALCPYCDFAVVVGQAQMHRRYLDAVVAEAEAHWWADACTSVFVGGGTPTAVDARALGGALERLRGIARAVDGAEVTVEANPDSVGVEHLGVLRDAGVNRVSIGAQSFDDEVLRALGRTHSADDVARAVEHARAAGFGNVSLDLIFGGPGETDASWERSLRRAVELGVEHVSCYALTIEERTAFGRAVARGMMSAPDDDALAARYETACEVLAAAGLEQYEVSNWSRPGFRCVHNMTYWTQGDYLGVGIGAHSHRSGVRWWNTRSIAEYLRAPTDARVGTEELDERARAEEWLSLTVRLVDGLDMAEAEQGLGSTLRDAADEIVAAGLAIREGDRLTLTARGRLLENEVTLRLLREPVAVR